VSKSGNGRKYSGVMSAQRRTNMPVMPVERAEYLPVEPGFCAVLSLKEWSKPEPLFIPIPNMANKIERITY
jgi:hypothetical protein